MKAMNYRSLNKQIKGMNKGEVVFINAINLSENSINLLRTFVKNGVLVPDKVEVTMMYKDVESVMNGTVILPQMSYSKA